MRGIETFRLPRVLSSLLLLFPVGFLAIAFLFLFLNPNELYFPYNFWHEFLNLWKKTYFFFISLGAILWARRKGLTAPWAKALDRTNEIVFLSILLLVSLLFRLGWVLWNDNQPYTDGLLMWREAQFMAAGKGFTNDGLEPTAIISPGYPFFLAGMIRLFGENLLAVKIVHVALSAAVPLLVYFIGREVFGKPTGLLAAAFLAVCPNAILGTAIFMNEHLYLPVTLLALALLLSDLRKPSLLKLIAAGVCFGLSDLTRGVFFLFPLLLLPLYLIARRTLREAWVKSALVVLGTAWVVLPWTYRNDRVMGYPVPVCTSAGIGLYSMNSAIADPYTTQLAELQKEHPEWVEFHPHPEVARYLAGSHYAIQWIRSDFRRFMKLGAGKLIAFFGLNTTWTNYHNAHGSTKFKPDTPVFEASEQLLKYYFAFHFCWFLVGGVILLTRYLFQDPAGMKTFVFVTLQFIIGMHFLFAGWPRYRYGMEPWIYLMSAFALIHFLDRSYVESYSSTVP